MRVILRPISPRSWSGLKKGGKYRNCYEDIGPYWTRSGRRYTGLTGADEKRLGERLGLDLTAGSEFWKNFGIRTFGKDLYLETEDAMDELRWLFLKGHKRVKESLSEQKATANFVLLNKDEEAKKSNLYNKIRREAMKEFDKLTPDDMRKCLRLYGHNGDHMSNEVAENRLFDIVEGNPQAFLDRWVNNERRETEVLIERAISKNIIRRNKNVYRYGTETIGHSLLDTAAFLDDPKNQDIKITLLKQIEAKEEMEIPVEDDVHEAVPTEKKTSSVEVEQLAELKNESRVKNAKKGDTI